MLGLKAEQRNTWVQKVKSFFDEKKKEKTPQALIAWMKKCWWSWKLMSGRREAREERPASAFKPPALHSLVFLSVWLSVKLIMDYSGRWQVLPLSVHKKGRMEAMRGVRMKRWMAEWMGILHWEERGKLFVYFFFERWLDGYWEKWMNERYEGKRSLNGWSGSGTSTWDNAGQPQVLMAYKSPELIFYWCKEPDRWTHKHKHLSISIYTT